VTLLSNFTIDPYSFFAWFFVIMGLVILWIALGISVIPWIKMAATA
jgi:hypothetical protein